MERKTAVLMLRKLLFFTLLSLSAFAFEPLKHLDKCRELSLSQNAPTSSEIYATRYVELEEAVGMELSDKDIQAQLKQFRRDASQIHPLQANSGNGLSGNPLYKITDGQGRPISIIKVFTDLQGSFSKEFFALEHFGTLDLKQLRLPKVLSVDARQVKGKKTFFLALEYIDAASLYDLFETLLEQAPESVERKKALATLLQAYAKLGSGLAELHGVAKSEPLPMHPVYEEIVRFLGNTVFDEVLPGVSPEIIQKAKECFSTQLAEQMPCKFVRGYMHGDANSGNYLYNVEQDQLWMIDLPDAASSIGQDNTPMGLPFFHLAQVQNQIFAKRSFGLNSEEYEQLTSAFFTHYVESGGALPSEKTLRFFANIDHLNFMSWYHKNCHRFDAATKQHLEIVYHARLRLIGAP